MHELHLAQDILQKLREKGEVRYAKIALGQARFTHLEELKELFNEISGGIKLDIEVLPVKFACVDCKAEFNPEEMRLDCPMCGSRNIKMVSGNELIVKEVR